VLYQDSEEHSVHDEGGEDEHDAGNITSDIRYDTVYLTCSKKLTGSQLRPPHRTNKKLKSETKNKPITMIGPVQSHCREGSPADNRNLTSQGFVQKLPFEPGVKQ